MKSALSGVACLSFLMPLAGADLPAVPAADALSIFGDYLEVRTADVYTGPCFANGEVNLRGKEAMLAWRVKGGEWQGVSLEGLSVVAIVKASATLGDPFSEPAPVRAVLVVDERADTLQSAALVDFARSMAGPLVENVVRVQRSEVHMEMMEGSGYASLQAGEIAELKTRALNHHDIRCGNEEIYYPPLTSVTTVMPAYALAHRFAGEGLNSKWSCPGKRSAFVGTFGR